MTLNNYKNISFLLSHWVLIALIVLVWVRFALYDTETNYEGNSGIKTRVSSTSKSNSFNQPISKYHIFGSAQQLYDVPLVQNNSSLNFKLNGTMTGSTVRDGFAYISNSQGVQKSFSVGDRIFDTATLQEVHENWILINNNGRTEKLVLTESSSQGDSRGRTSSKQIVNNKPATNSYMKHLNGAQQRNWQQMLDQQKFDPNRISSVVGNINLVTDQAGQIQGLRVSNLADGNLLKKHGLESNDIITAINGNRISGNNITTIRQTLQQNPNATITVKRNGKIQNIKVNISEL